MKSLLALLCLLSSSLDAGTRSPPFVTAKFSGHLGNNMFQIAAAEALAWDHGVVAYFPDLNPRSAPHRHVFFRCHSSASLSRFSFRWHEPSYAYTPIPYRPNMQISGYFQSEKYFSHHREKILALFAPSQEDSDYIQKNYSFLLNHPNTVGVQIRYYRGEDPGGATYPQYGKEYLEKALALFSPDTLFIVSSNNSDYARRSMPAWAKEVYYLEGEPNYIDLFILSLCKHNIITNSSFGWWAAWLNQNPNKTIVRPDVWVYGLPCQDVCPEEWISIKTNYE